MKQSTVFISHASEDDAVADLISEELTNRGIDTWLDHHKLRSGQFWPEEIQQSLDTCHSGIFILTNFSQSSRECYFEWSYLLGKAVKLHLVIYNEHELETFPYRLHTCQRVNLDHGLDEGIALLAASVSMDIFPMDAATAAQVERGVAGHMVRLEYQIVKTVKMVLDKAIEAFERGVNTFLRRLANFLNLSRQELSLLNIRPGSVVMEIEMPGFAADVLMREMKIGKAAFLKEFAFKSVEVIEIRQDKSRGKEGQEEKTEVPSSPAGTPAMPPAGMGLVETGTVSRTVSESLFSPLWQTMLLQSNLVTFIAFMLRVFAGSSLQKPTFGQMANLYRDIQSNQPQNPKEMSQLLSRYPFLKDIMYS